MDFSMTDRVKDLVSSGVITVQVRYSKDGIESWAQAVQPHPRLGIRTTQSFELSDVEEAFKKVTTTRPTNSIPGSVVTPPVREQGLRPIFSTIDEAILFSEKNKLKENKVGGLLNYLPIDSITPTDMDRDNTSLYARACAVANKIGTSRLVSRISTQPLLLRVEGATNLHEWWEGADVQKRLLILIKTKHFKHMSNGKPLLKSTWVEKLSSLPHPFREAEAQVDQPDEETSAEDSEGYYDPFDSSLVATPSGNF
jgi:hypothetical protein